MVKITNQKLLLGELLEQALVKEEDRQYEVPDNWVWTRLGSICFNVQYGYTAKSSPNIVGKKLLRITDIQDELVDWYNVPYCLINSADYEKYKLRNNDIVVARTGATTGKSYMISESIDAVFASYLIRVSLKKELNAKFLYKFMQSNVYWNQITDLVQGIAQPGVNATKLQTMAFPLPPFAEQQRIVDIIESQFEKLDKAKELVQNALDSFESRKAAILHKAFTGELTAKWREENGNSFEEWQAKEIGSMLKPMTTKKPNIDDKYFYYIDIDAINNKNQTIKNPKKLLVSEAPSRASRGLENEDILFSLVRPYLKNIAFINNELSKCIASTGFYVCRSKEMLYPYYLYYFLCSQDTLNYYTSLMKGDNSPSIRKVDFEGLQINLPPLEEQKEIVRILDNLLENEQRAKELCDVIDKIEIMKKAILARAFRGELGTNNPEEDSAVELLKEILKNKNKF